MRTDDARSLPALAQEALRRKAVNVVLEGKSQVEVARVFGVIRQAVGKWVKTYRHGGAKQLTARRRGRPKGGSLEPWQQAQVVRTVTERHPEQLRLPFFLWTREAVVQLIEDRFGVRVSVWTAGRYLKQWGFTPQKPVRRAFEQDPEAVRRWLEQDYPAIRARAKREQAEIYWGDEMGLRADHAWGVPLVAGVTRRLRARRGNALGAT